MVHKCVPTHMINESELRPVLGVSYLLNIIKYFHWSNSFIQSLMTAGTKSTIRVNQTPYKWD